VALDGCHLNIRDDDLEPCGALNRFRLFPPNSARLSQTPRSVLIRNPIRVSLKLQNYSFLEIFHFPGSGATPTKGLPSAPRRGKKRKLYIRLKGDTQMLTFMKKFIRDEEGQDLVEYALLLVFLALAAITILPTLGSSVNKVFSQSNSALNAS
jgi:Flp pilus assembly pilin Flp